MATVRVYIVFKVRPEVKAKFQRVKEEYYKGYTHNDLVLALIDREGIKINESELEPLEIKAKRKPSYLGK